MPAIEPFRHRLRVRYVECDMQGRVFNAHYLTWFDLAHTELLRATAGPYTALVAAGWDLVVAEAGVRYRGAARFDDELELEVLLAPLTTASMTSSYAVRRDGELLTEGWVRHVCVDAASFAKRPWPASLRSAVAPYVSSSASTSSTSPGVPVTESR